MGDEAGFSIVVLPFLKTSRAFELGGLRFRATTDVDGLPDAEARAVREVAAMLFVQDHWRIASATYAIVRGLDVEGYPRDTSQLERIQSVIAFAYTGTNDTSGRAFLSTEHATMVVLSPSRVPRTLLAPFNVEWVGEGPAPKGTKEDGEGGEKWLAEGYAGCTTSGTISGSRRVRGSMDRSPIRS